VISGGTSNTPLLQCTSTPANFFMEDKQKSKFQLIWGILLLLAGIGVFFRIPQLMPGIKKIEQFASFIYFIYFCFYLLAILLIAGGGKKVYTYLKQSNAENAKEDVE
jgi:cobalamin biosynthesis protein CobD/CbiB